MSTQTTQPVPRIDRDTAASWLPRRKADGHKGDFGRVLIFGGAVGFTGAPVLAARGCLRSGAGLVTVLTPAQVYPIVAANCLETMARPMPERMEDTLALVRAADGVLAGPGLGRGEAQTQLILTLTRETACPLILDADGINCIAEHIDVLDGRSAPTILTPHEGEFARLGGDLSRGRAAGARAFATAHRCVLVLKGHRTVVALPDGRCLVNCTGNSGMATGGSGDVLGGMLLALLGQGLSPERAAACGVWLHGRAGDLAAEDKGEHGMLPSDLIEQIPYAIKELI